MSGYRDSKWVSVGMPVAFVVFALVMVYVQYHRLTEARSDLASSEKKLSELEATLKKSQIEPVGEKIPSVPATKEENNRFVAVLKTTAQQAGAAIVKWNSTTRPAGSDDQGPRGAPPPELKGITEVVSELEIFGSYEGVRAFVKRLEAWPRLVNMNNVTWRRGNQSGTHLQMTVIRYVTEAKEARSSGGTP